MRMPAAFGLSFLATAFLAARPGQDMEAMMKWTSANVVHYHVVGDFTGTTKVLKSKEGDVRGKVSDRVEIDFDWDQTQQKMIGDPVFKNFPTTLESVENAEGCPAVKVDGPVEYFTFQSVSAMAVMFELRGTRDLPPGSFAIPPQSGPCGAARAQASAVSEPATARMQLALGMMLALPATPGFEMEITPDHKSFIQKINTDGWIWTMTPAIVK